MDDTKGFIVFSDDEEVRKFSRDLPPAKRPTAQTKTGVRTGPNDRSTYRDILDWWGRQTRVVKVMLIVVGLIPGCNLYNALTEERQAAQPATSIRSSRTVAPQPRQPSSREPARTVAQQNYLNALGQSGLISARLNGNTLAVVVPDSWYRSAEFEKRRLVQTIAAGLISARKEDGAEDSAASYAFVDVKDRYGELVASYSAWTGIKIRR